MTSVTLSELPVPTGRVHRADSAPVPCSASLPTEVYYGCKVVIQDKANLTKKLNQFIADGPGALSVITDFDFTLSRFHNKRGERGFSCHKLLEDSGLLVHDYHVQAQAVQAHYYPIEIDPLLDQAARLPLMIEWAHRSHELLVKYGLTKEILAQAVVKAVANEDIRLRDRLVAFMAAARSADIPVLVFSAGIADVLEGVLGHFIDMQDHAPYVISNRCIWDGEVLVAFPEPIIHVFNKRAAHFLQTPFFSRPDCCKRQNVLVIGDSLGDVHMQEGYETVVPQMEVIKVGFLSDKVQERMQTYAEVFDIVILEDPGFDVPLGLLEAICKKD